MHEFSIASALLDQVLEVAEQNGMEKVSEVELEVGTLQLIVPDALETAFAALCENTMAAGARLIQNEVPPRARCRDCDHEFEAAIDHYQCPQCQGANTQIISGRDIILKTLSGPSESEQQGGAS